MNTGFVRSNRWHALARRPSNSFCDGCNAALPVAPATSATVEVGGSPPVAPGDKHWRSTHAIERCSGGIRTEQRATAGAMRTGASDGMGVQHRVQPTELRQACGEQPPPSRAQMPSRHFLASAETKASRAEVEHRDLEPITRATCAQASEHAHRHRYGARGT